MEVLRMPIIEIPVLPELEESDGILVENLIPPKGQWTEGFMETDIPASLLHTSIAAIIRQPEPGEPAGDAEAIIEVNNAWQVDVRWEFNGRAAHSIVGFWRARLYFESLGDDAFDREAKYPRDIAVDGRQDTYHVQFKIGANQLQVDADEGTPYQLTVAVVLMVNSGDAPDKLVPGPAIGKVSFPLIQAFQELIPSPVP
jgi:hypothetical protein